MELFLRHNKILFVSFSVFIATTFAFFFGLKLGWISQFHHQETFVNLLHRKIVDENLFTQIFLNNLKVLFFTILISIISLAGFLFMIIWNSSIVSYFIFLKTTTNTSALVLFLNLLPHGLLEIGGYVLGGLCGILISFSITKSFLKKIKYEIHLFKDVFLIVIGAVFESLI